MLNCCKSATLGFFLLPLSPDPSTIRSPPSRPWPRSPSAQLTCPRTSRRRRPRDRRGGWPRPGAGAARPRPGGGRRSRGSRRGSRGSSTAGERGSSIASSVGAACIIKEPDPDYGYSSKEPDPDCSCSSKATTSTGASSSSPSSPAQVPRACSNPSRRSPLPDFGKQGHAGLPRWWYQLLPLSSVRYLPLPSPTTYCCRCSLPDHVRADLLLLLAIASAAAVGDCLCYCYWLLVLPEKWTDCG